MRLPFSATLYTLHMARIGFSPFGVHGDLGGAQCPMLGVTGNLRRVRNFGHPPGTK